MFAIFLSFASENTLAMTFSSLYLLWHRTTGLYPHLDGFDFPKNFRENVFAFDQHLFFPLLVHYSSSMVNFAIQFTIYLPLAHENTLVMTFPALFGNESTNHRLPSTIWNTVSCLACSGKPMAYPW